MMKHLGIALLAAGKSERFGSNKLLADFGGRPLVCRALEAMHAIPAGKRCVVTGSDEVAALAREYGCDVIANHKPELGQSHSIHLGVHAMQDMDAVLFLVGDQPLLSRESLLLLVQSYLDGKKGIACLCDQSHMGNPAVFGSQYFPELLALRGDRGAKGILRAHEEDLLVVSAFGENELSDADTPQMLERISIKEPKMPCKDLNG